MTLEWCRAAASFKERRQTLCASRTRENRHRSLWEAVIRMSETLTAHAGSKHLRTPQAFIHDEVREGLVKCQQTTSDENGADSYTKSPARPKFKKDMRKTMGPQPGLE